jgi:hypothetical protein
LSTAIFCVQCELISANTTPCCLACGSKAVLGLSRLLGGSLRAQPSARVIEDAELNRLVRELVRTVPASESEYLESGDSESEYADASIYRSSRQHVRGSAESGEWNEGRSLIERASIRQIDLEPAIGVITERAQALTGATGAAIGLRKGNEVICRARAGRTAPDLGVRLQTDSGISAECLRSGEIVLCNDAEDHPHVDLASCRRLGARSILAAPLRQFHRTLGIFEVLSAAPNAFNHQDAATLQLLSSMMVAAIARIPRLGPLPVPR